MAERTTQIRPLGELEVQNIRSIIAQSYIGGRRILNIGRSRREFDFTSIGVFNMSYDGLFRNGTNQMWAQKLLEYDPKETILDTDNGQLVVLDDRARHLESIPPADIRRLDRISGYAQVIKSGYVLSKRLYRFDKGMAGMKASDLEKILIAAEGRKRPRDFSSETFVKVDGRCYVGRTLWVGIFAEECSRDRWDRDAVVIDPETRKLVPCQVFRPLLKEKWVKPSSFATL